MKPRCIHVSADSARRFEQLLDNALEQVPDGARVGVEHAVASHAVGAATKRVFSAVVWWELE